jgi:hypothetical protein
MASPDLEDTESDYGSDFSPEEVVLIQRLLLATDKEGLGEDNPTVNGTEYHDETKAMRVPRVLGRERRTPELETTFRQKGPFGAIPLPVDLGNPDRELLEEFIACKSD